MEGDVPRGDGARLVRAASSTRWARDGVTLCDTTGMAYPSQVARADTRPFASAGPHTELTLHFHNTRGMGLANVLAAIDAGADRFDASLGGIGGCPYAPGATGNVCSEEIVHALELMGYDTGVDLALLIAAGEAPAGPDRPRHPEPDRQGRTAARPASGAGGFRRGPGTGAGADGVRFCGWRVGRCWRPKG